jgi:superfamily II DNA or RNA helicase
MTLSLVPKESGKAYIANQLWLPKRGIRVGPVQKALEFQVPGKDEEGKAVQVDLRLWSESRNHLIVPREFLHTEDYPNYTFPFIDLRPQFPEVDFEDLVVPRDEEQQLAADALELNDNGMLVLACGKGKTKLAQKWIARQRTPALVIVPDGGILSQWQESIYGDGEKKLPGLRFNGTMGLIQGQTFDWQHPVTLALVTTLALRIKEGKVPEEMFRFFGSVVYDEVHRIGAPFFSLTAPPFYGNRLGLTATWKREDGLDPIYRFHIGEPFYADLKQQLIPRIYFEQTPIIFNFSSTKLDKVLNIPMLRSMLGKDPNGNIYRYWAIKDALSHGRKILCLSHSKAQLKLLHACFPGSGLILGATPKAERMSILRNSQVCFAISKLGSEGVDDDALDTLFWLTPFRSKIALQQSMGRIQRSHPTKLPPVMVVFEDVLVNPLKGLCRKLRQNLKEWGFTVETVPPQPYPRSFTPEVHWAYEQERIELAELERARAELDAA